MSKLLILGCTAWLLEATFNLHSSQNEMFCIVTYYFQLHYFFILLLSISPWHKYFESGELLHGVLLPLAKIVRGGGPEHTVAVLMYSTIYVGKNCDSLSALPALFSNI
jgi:hypothetical protein